MDDMKKSLEVEKDLCKKLVDKFENKKFLYTSRCRFCSYEKECDFKKVG